MAKSIMEKNMRNNCLSCKEFPYDCDECYSELASLMNLKNRNLKKKYLTDGEYTKYHKQKI